MNATPVSTELSNPDSSITTTVHQRILRFWFGNDVYGAFPVEKVQFWHADDSDSHWLAEHSEQLGYIEENFLFLVKSACNGGLRDWREEPDTCLALILVLDQFAKRLLHGKEFEQRCRDEALQLCRYGIQQRLDSRLTPVERCFFYGPMLYAEKISLRAVGLQLLQNLLEQVSYPDNPFYHHRSHVMLALYRAIAHKAHAEKRILSAIA